MAKGDDVTVGWYICEAIVRAQEAHDLTALEKAVQSLRALWEAQTAA